MTHCALVNTRCVDCHFLKTIIIEKNRFFEMHYTTLFKSTTLENDDALSGNCFVQQTSRTDSLLITFRLQKSFSKF